jgi:hypothetical protein
MPLDHNIWTEFCGDLESRTDNLVAELSGCWRDLSALTALLEESFASFTAPEIPNDRVQSFDAFYTDSVSALLAGPLAAFSQKRPLQRSLSAMEEHQTALDDLVRRLPKTVELNRRELAGLAAVEHRPNPWLRWPLRDKTRAIPLRDAVADHLEKLILSRAELDGDFQLLLAQSTLHLLLPWQTCHRTFLASLTQSGHERADVDAVRKWWIETAHAWEQRGFSMLARYAAWSKTLSARVSGAVLRRPQPFPAGRRAKWTSEHQKHVSFWSRQQRAARSVIDLELQLSRLARETNYETTESLVALDAEHAELIDELDSAIAWLRQCVEAGARDSFPQPKARLLSSDERASEWLRRVSVKARGVLPLTIETVEPHHKLPGWRTPWRDLEPAKVFLGALSAVGTPPVLAGFREAGAAHRAIVREIERAREVIDFGFETARLERASGAEFAREAIENALSLLSYQRETTRDVRPVVEASAVWAEAAVLLDTNAALEKSRIGLLAHVTRRRGGEVLRRLANVTDRGLRAGSQRLWTGTRTGYRWALLKIGWIPAPPKAVEPVVRRSDLADTLVIQLHTRELPMIYRRLFRLSPVEDPRFLVGREAEMAGFADALHRWESGKGASAIVIGARGSGKTSLINCATSGVFAQYEVVRGQFCERLAKREQMAAFVRNLLGTAPQADVIAALGERRRVILIEEFERTFLRTVGGFEALEMLLDLMYSTGRSTLWVFSVNETAYRYLEAVTGLGRHFSHRINAMSVKQADLTNAILQRHGLSGLRLEFAPLPEQDPRVSGIRRLLGFEQDPQKIFLDSLYEQSEGIFRAAFELWQGSIERVEGGVVHMRQPLAPEYDMLSREMSLDDCFTLKAILQHGSLTADELAQVLAINREDSVRQLDRLGLLEVLEPEPASPGVRIRPEAGRLVRETLNRRNLL